MKDNYCIILLVCSILLFSHHETLGQRNNDFAKITVCVCKNYGQNQQFDISSGSLLDGRKGVDNPAREWIKEVSKWITFIR